MYLQHKVEFGCELDAKLVAEQLYNCELDGTILRFPREEKRSVCLAISLVDVLVVGAQCQLPFPVDERECTDDDVPQIYVACLGAYNHGLLHGMWINATQDADEIEDDIKWMLSWSPCRMYEACDEWAIHDSMNFNRISISEWESLEKISAIAQAIDEHGAAIAAFIDWQITCRSDYEIQDIVDDFESYYLGQWDSEEDFVLKSDEIEEVLQWKEFEEKFTFWSQCIDWAKVANELFMQDYYSVRVRDYEYNSWGVYVFRQDY